MIQEGGARTSGQGEVSSSPPSLEVLQAAHTFRPQKLPRKDSQLWGVFLKKKEAIPSKVYDPQKGPVPSLTADQ